MTNYAVPSPNAPWRGDRLVWILVVLYAAVYSWLALQKARYYLYGDFDLAIFAQAEHGILHGTLFNSIRGMNWLGDHSSLSLFLIAPIYALCAQPATLLVLQSVVLALGAIPVYRLARAQLDSPRAGLAFAALYLLYPALGFSNLYEFHPETLSTTFLLFAFLYLSEQKLGRMVLFAALALLGREDVALVVGGMGIYALFLGRPGRARYALALVGLAAVSLVVSFGVLKPMFNSGEADFGLLYSHWGATPATALRALLSHPMDALRSLVATPNDAVDSALKKSFYGQLLLPLAFLPLLNPGTLLIALPIALEHLLADGQEHHTIVYHYTALITPVVFVSAIFGFRNLQRWVGRGTRRWILATLAVACLASNLWFGPFALQARAAGAPGEPVWPSVADRTTRPERDRLVRLVPAQGGVIASFAFLDRFANRGEVHSAHHILCGHYTISQRPYPLPRGIAAVLADFDPNATLASVDLGTGQRLRDVMAANRLRPVDASGTLLLCTQADAVAPDSLELWSIAPTFDIATPQSVEYDGRLELRGNAIMRVDVAPGQTLPVRTYWGRKRPIDGVYVLSFVFLDASNRVAAQSTAFLGTPLNPAHLWPVDATARTTDRLLIPLDLRPGRYTLALRLGAWDGAALRLAECNAPEVVADRMLCRLGSVNVTGVTLRGS